MGKCARWAVFGLLIQWGAVVFAAAQDSTENWPRWRGPGMDGIARGSDPPVEWGEGRNVAWKVAIPGQGASTPIIWGRTILIQTAVPVGEEMETRQALDDWQRSGREIYPGRSYVKALRKTRFALLALDRASGEVLWRKVLREELPHEGVHPTNTWASASPATDGEHIVAYFGSRGLYVLDMKGHLLWEKDLGDMDTRNGWGEGASPALHKDTIVVVWDHEGDSFIAAFDKHSGEELWRTPREEVTSWFTPLVVEHEGRAQVITTGAGHVRGYDLKTGEVLWTGPGLTVNSIPTPVASRDKVFLTAGYRGNVLLAMDLDKAEGDLEQSGAIDFRYGRDTPYVASPLLYKGTLYFSKHLRSILTAMDAETGKVLYGPVRLQHVRQFYASPVAASGRIYWPGRQGSTLVLEHGPELKIQAVNELEDGFDASPAVVDDELYLRGRRFLYRISAPEAGDGAR